MRFREQSMCQITRLWVRELVRMWNQANVRALRKMGVPITNPSGVARNTKKEQSSHRATAHPSTRRPGGSESDGVLRRTDRHTFHTRGAFHRPDLYKTI